MINAAELRWIGKKTPRAHDTDCHVERSRRKLTFRQILTTSDHSLHYTTLLFNSTLFCYYQPYKYLFIVIWFNREGLKKWNFPLLGPPLAVEKIKLFFSRNLTILLSTICKKCNPKTNFKNDIITFWQASFCLLRCQILPWHAHWWLQHA